MIAVNEVYCMDALELLRQMGDGSVNCIVTSPPYFGLRDYGVDGQIGLEQTPAEYVARLVAVFREARRVLRDDGTFWLNLGDSYATRLGGDGWGDYEWKTGGKVAPAGGTVSDVKRTREDIGVAPKNLLGIPWRVAFGLQDDGWILRSEIIWHKPNPMPESVTDRPTKAHETVFLFAKSPRYWYDADAIREDSAPSSVARSKYNGKQTAQPKANAGVEAGIYCGVPSMAKAYGQGRNKRSVWTIATQPFSGAHFAVFPPKLIEPMILAGCPAGGVVYDPFMGSGTTALVARRLGRQFIGSELNADYCEIACQRLAEPYTPSFLDAVGEVRS